MTLLAAGLAGCAVGWWLLPPQRTSLRRLHGRPDGRHGRALTIVGVILLVCLGVGAAFALGGPVAAVTTLAAAELVGTAGFLLLGRRRRIRAQRARKQVAGACAAVAGQVRVGRVAGEALALAAQDFDVLAVAARTHALGGDLVAVLRVEGRRPGCAGLTDLANAWQLAQDTGAPLAAALEQVAESLRSDQAIQGTVGAELAGPRATSRIMAVLPLCGIGMGYALGGDPVGFLAGGPLGWLCLSLGVTLACAGVVWIDQLARATESGGG